jgi:hypothetical protein
MGADMAHWLLEIYGQAGGAILLGNANTPTTAGTTSLSGSTSPSRIRGWMRAPYGSWRTGAQVHTYDEATCSPTQPCPTNAREARRSHGPASPLA